MAFFEHEVYINLYLSDRFFNYLSNEYNGIFNQIFFCCKYGYTKIMILDRLSVLLIWIR